MFALRVRMKTGQRLINKLTPENTIKDLKVELSNVSKIPEEKLQILIGFPPKAIDATKDNLTLCESGIISGDTIILEEKTSSNQFNSRMQENNACQGIKTDCIGVLLKKVVPADNSCLFSSVLYVMTGKLEDGAASAWMRKLIAETLIKNKEEYSEAILGKPNEEYCTWIQDDKSWGGAIELSILSNHYKIEIDVVDTMNGIINRFGEDKQYDLRVFLIFDGVHYDPLFFETYDVFFL